MAKMTKAEIDNSFYQGLLADLGGEWLREPRPGESQWILDFVPVVNAVRVSFVNEPRSIVYYPNGSRILLGN